MIYNNTKSKGSLAEIRTVSRLVEAGYAVSLPFGENMPYDLVAEAPSGTLYRLQVRWVSWRKDALTISLRAVSKNYVRTLDLTRIDAFVAHDGKDFHWIPIAEIRGHRATFSLRRRPARNNQQKNVRLAKAYTVLKKMLP